MGFSAPNSTRQTLSLPRFAQQESAETQRHQVDFSCEPNFLQSFFFICGIAVRVYRLFPVLKTTNFFCSTRILPSNCAGLACPYHKD